MSLRYLVVGFLSLGFLVSVQTADALPKKGTLRISGDNSWVAFIDGKEVAKGNNWQAPTVTEFVLSRGSAMIAIYVHDADPGAAGRGGFLADIILDDKPKYIGTGDDGWRCNAGKPINSRKDGWQKPKFNDGKWKELQLYEEFGAGIWGFGAAQMRQILKDPDCTAKWAWCGPNDGEDDVYFRYTIGTLAVDYQEKLTTSWGKIRTTILRGDTG